MKTAFRNNLKHNAALFVCTGLIIGFFLYITADVSAFSSNDPYAQTPEKMGIFQGLPQKFNGLFNSGSQALNGFFRSIEQNFGGASPLQGTPSRDNEYPPYLFQAPVSSDFIKITSSWAAACQQDAPPDQLYPALTERPNITVCPWVATTAQAPACPGIPGVGCCLGSTCQCIEVCLNSSGGFHVTNNCSGTIGDVTIQGSGGFICGPFNLAAGRSVDVCTEFGIFTSATVTDAKAGGACQISDPSDCCPNGAKDTCSVGS